MFHFLHLFLCTYKSVWQWSTWKLSLSRTRTPSSRVISAEERESSSREEKVDNSMVWKVGIWRCTFCILSEAPQQIVYIATACTKSKRSNNRLTIMWCMVTDARWRLRGRQGLTHCSSLSLISCREDAHVESIHIKTFFFSGLLELNFKAQEKRSLTSHPPNNQYINQSIHCVFLPSNTALELFWPNMLTGHLQSCSVSHNTE